MTHPRGERDELRLYSRRILLYRKDGLHPVLRIFRLVSDGKHIAGDRTVSVSNSLAAIAVCAQMGIPEKAMQEALSAVRVRGRCEAVPVYPEMTLLIDYAHNAMSLESLLKTLRKYHPKRLICLFGCGGNRARNRRFQMGEVSGRLADLTVITSDNPRDEEPQAILDDIRTGIGKTEGAFVEIADRKEAIRYVIENRQPGDLVVLAGKGHETYQIRKGKRYEMDERVLIREILEESKGNV